MDTRSISEIIVTYKNITIVKEKNLYDLMYNLMNTTESISTQGVKDLITYFTNANLCGRIRFKSFSNKEKRLLMNLLNRCQNKPKDFFIWMVSTNSKKSAILSKTINKNFYPIKPSYEYSMDKNMSYQGLMYNKEKYEKIHLNW
ncbi:hypothetical protein PIROE2DRAFT_19384 [Piromyces sp. E2]|nr:hypothetical protein PIROE2DRAFT_19384 [Piromyces sp. E2]|eukprot:OUM56149.1 hypothetical protein PIROE2DRAFT_19384 [Piromyces sp. E2]